MKDIFKNIETYPFYDFMKETPKKFQYSSYESEIDFTGGDISGGWSNDFHYKNLDTIKKHIKSRPDRVKKYKWVNDDGSIRWPKYNTNKFGFRTSLEYKNGTSIAIGCSYTFGLGVHEEHTWPYLLSKELGKDIINLGMCGGSMDSSYRILKWYLGEYKPEYVFFLLPSVLRQELFYRRENNRIGTLKLMPGHSNWSSEDKSKVSDECLKNFYSLDDNIYLNFYKNLEAIRYLCDINGVNLIEQLNHAMYNQNYVLDKNNINFEDTPSFDSLHYGPEIHELIMNDIKRLI